jgi:hypothetical protein
MKIYCWRPNGHGPLTFSVLASSEVEAQTIIDNYIQEHFRESNGRLRYEAQGWDTGGYELFVYQPGQVMVHEND